LYRAEPGRVVKIGSGRDKGRHLIAEIGHGQEITNVCGVSVCQRVVREY
jgi:ribosomal protein L14E/L6E/L27E